MKNILILIVLISCSAQIIFAQPLNRKTGASMISTAEKALSQHNYYKALEWYEKAYNTDSNPDLLLAMAELNYKLRDYTLAAESFKKYFKKSGNNAGSDKRFEYGLTLKMLGNYSEAISQLELAAKQTKNNAQILSAIKGAKMAMESEPDDRVTVVNAGNVINTRNSEYAPMIVGDDLYFVSLLEDQIVELDKNNSKGFGTKILTSKRTNGNWSTPVQLNENINRAGYFNSNVTISSDGKEMLFTRQLLSEGNKLLESKLYRSIKVGGVGDWAPAQELASFNKEGVTKSPAFGELYGKKVVFFASDKAGGFGGYDIYYAVENGQGSYDEPVNLGSEINTAGNEDTPNYTDGKLYFSSTGWPGFGGYDIFNADWKGDAWSTPVNMGLPYNSSVDDLDFMLAANGEQGYLASNRPDPQAQSLKSKTCCNDIYSVNITKIEVIADLIAKTFDKTTGAGLNGATVQLIPQGNNSGKILRQTNNSGNIYNYALANNQQYLLVASAKDYIADTLIFDTNELLASVTFEKRLELTPVPKPIPEPEYITVTKEEAITLNNIYYDYNDDKITAAAEPDLQLLFEILKENPLITKIELSSHTDARGGADFNQKLSQRRAASARQWILNKGISPDRIVAKGYGKTSPKTVDARLNEKNAFLPVGTTLTPEYIAQLANKEQREAAHQINRRTEFKIVDGPTSIKIEEKRLKQ